MLESFALLHCALMVVIMNAIMDAIDALAPSSEYCRSITAE